MPTTRYTVLSPAKPVSKNPMASAQALEQTDTTEVPVHSWNPEVGAKASEASSHGSLHLANGEKTKNGLPILVVTPDGFLGKKLANGGLVDVAKETVIVVPATEDGREPSYVVDKEHHFSHRSPWLRAALLGANDGLVSVASLMLGVSAVRSDHSSVIISGLSGLVAGACSMAIGEYVSVYGQRDTEEADLQKERNEHAKGPEARARELEELTQIYVSRGLTYRLANEVAIELTKVDPIRAHARDELGIDVDDMSNPLQAAVVSAISFSVGALVPLLSASFIKNSDARLSILIVVSTLAFMFFGALGAFLGGAPLWKATARCTSGGWLSMAITYGVLRAFGAGGL